MCRLYGFHSTADRKVECELIDAQNALIRQSESDERGEANAHGWGLTAYRNGTPVTRKEPLPAHESEDFRWAAAEMHSDHVIAHIRRATQGVVSEENTHPFTHEQWTLAHNGHVDGFDAVRDRMFETMDSDARDRIGGQTDSEHIFHYLLSEAARRPNEQFLDTLEESLSRIQTWSRSADPDGETALNLLISDGRQTWGSRYGRSLWYVRRSEVHICDICGERHAEVDPDEDYRAVDVASERITNSEQWLEMPDEHVFHIPENCEMTIRPMRSIRESGAG